MVDTTGCGDAFAGAVAVELAIGADLFAATGLAVRYAALAATAVRRAELLLPTAPRSRPATWAAEPRPRSVRAAVGRVPRDLVPPIGAFQACRPPCDRA